MFPCCGSILKAGTCSAILYNVTRVKDLFLVSQVRDHSVDSLTYGSGTTTVLKGRCFLINLATCMPNEYRKHIIGKDLVYYNFCIILVSFFSFSMFDSTLSNRLLYMSSPLNQLNWLSDWITNFLIGCYGIFYLLIHIIFLFSRFTQFFN